MIKPFDRTRGTGAALLFALLAMLTVLVYLPALRGGFLFDDGYYFVDNADVHVTTGDLGSWMRAAFSQAGANQFRALGMLTFAANYYFTGADPFWLKLTNLCIHVLNGVLLFGVLCALFRLRRSARAAVTPGAEPQYAAPEALVAAFTAGAWMLLPINLTAVAYVSQRLESLANVFVLLGLFVYARARERQLISGRGGATMLLAIVACTALGVCTKESAVLLPLYTACIEFAITGFRDADGKPSKAAIGTHFVTLVLPFIAGLLWISRWDFAAFANVRNFTVGERLLTEARVLVDYIGWTLLPKLNALTFYHDDLKLSHGLLDPPTTALAIVTLALLLGAAVWQRRRRPLFSLGVLWFFAGHMLTGTIIPLELVFEHRNYFPSAGLLLALASLLAIEPLTPFIRARVVLGVGLVAFFAFTTLLRAQEWSHPLRLAMSEASKRPDSMRAQYELAHTLILGAGTDDEAPALKKAADILERIAHRPESDITPLHALIYLDARLHRPIDPSLWSEMAKKLAERAPSQSDIAALRFLLHCQLRGECPPQKEELFKAYTAALTRSNGDLNLMSAYADFAYLELGDAELAERMLREVVASSPRVVVYRTNLIELLIATHRVDEADAELQRLKTLDHHGSLDATIAKLRAEIAAARSSPPAASEIPKERSLPTGAANP